MSYHLRVAATALLVLTALTSWAHQTTDPVPTRAGASAVNGPASPEATRTGAATGGTKRKGAAVPKSASGTVAAVDAASRSFVVHPTTGANLIFKTNDKTRYFVGKNKGVWADVKPGAEVTVTYDNDGTNKRAIGVKIAAATG
jgi:hypothetical protein